MAYQEDFGPFDTPGSDQAEEFINETNKNKSHDQLELLILPSVSEVLFSSYKLFVHKKNLLACY